jgi:hypothetical protein
MFPEPLPIAFTRSVYWAVNVTLTVFAALMLFTVQVAVEALPLVESQPVHSTVE